MTLCTNWYPESNKLGVDLNNVQTSVDSSTINNPSYPGSNAKLGDNIKGNNGSEWIFVQASTTVTAYNAVVIDNTFMANNMTSALVASNVYAYGMAEFQSSNAQPGDFFWALLKANGGIHVNVSPSVGRGVNLYISAVAGSFTSSVTSNAINGIELVASIGTSASSPGEGIIRHYIWPALNVKVAGATT